MMKSPAVFKVSFLSPNSHLRPAARGRWEGESLSCHHCLDQCPATTLAAYTLLALHPNRQQRITQLQKQGHINIQRGIKVDRIEGEGKQGKILILLPLFLPAPIAECDSAGGQTTGIREPAASNAYKCLQTHIYTHRNTCTNTTLTHRHVRHWQLERPWYF